MCYISSRILGNFPKFTAIWLKKGKKTKHLPLSLFLFKLFISKIPDLNKNTGTNASPVLIKVKQGHMLCVVDTYWFSPVASYFTGEKSKYSVVVVLLCSVCVGAPKFLQDPPQVQASHVGWSVDYNCTTDDPYATVSLLRSKDFGVSYNVFPVSPNKLLLRKQVFTVVNLIYSDGGYYKCKATDQSGQTIEWNSGSMLFVQAGLYVRIFWVNCHSWIAN